MPGRFFRSLFLYRDYILIFKSNAPYHFSRSMESACVTVQNPERFLASFEFVNVRFSNENINFLLLNLQKIDISLEEKLCSNASTDEHLRIVNAFEKS